MTCPLPQSWTMDVAFSSVGGANVLQTSFWADRGPCGRLSPVAQSVMPSSVLLPHLAVSLGPLGSLGNHRPARPGLTSQEFGEIRAQIDSRLAPCSRCCFSHVTLSRVSSAGAPSYQSTAPSAAKPGSYYVVCLIRRDISVHNGGTSTTEMVIALYCIHTHTQ